VDLLISKILNLAFELVIRNITMPEAQHSTAQHSTAQHSTWITYPLN